MDSANAYCDRRDSGTLISLMSITGTEISRESRRAGLNSEQTGKGTFFGLVVSAPLHSKRISICVLNETGQVVHRAQVRAISQMMRILEGLPDRFDVCFEASCGYGHYDDLLRPWPRGCSWSIPASCD